MVYAAEFLRRSTLDLGEFCRRYWADGHGRAAFDPEIAQFRARHQEALGGLVSEVLRLLAAECMVSLGTLSLLDDVRGHAFQRLVDVHPVSQGALADPQVSCCL